MSNPISFEGRVTATQDETESAPATESAPENEQRFAAQTVHSFNFQIMIDRFGQHPPTLLVEEWENRTRYQVPRNRTFSEWHKAGRSRTRRQLTGASTLSFAISSMSLIVRRPQSRSGARLWTCDLSRHAVWGIRHHAAQRLVFSAHWYISHKPVLNYWHSTTWLWHAMAMGYFFCEAFVISREHPRMGITHMIRLDSVREKSKLFQDCELL